MTGIFTLAEVLRVRASCRGFWTACRGAAAHHGCQGPVCPPQGYRVAADTLPVRRSLAWPCLRQPSIL